MLCSETSLVNHGDTAIRAVTLKCRSWSCELCKPERQKQLMAKARCGKPTTFITLTVTPKFGSSPEDRARRLADAWRVIVRRAKKKYRYKEIPYFCVFEATKKGEPHLHILARVKWIDQKWLSDQMRELMKAPIVDIRQVTDLKEIASYIAKYVGKAPHRFATCKRYWTTRAWELVDYVRDEINEGWAQRWDTVDLSLEALGERWRAQGYDVVREGHMVIARRAGAAPGASKRKFKYHDLF